MPRRFARANGAEEFDWAWAAECAPLLFLDVEAKADAAARILSGARQGGSFGPSKLVAASCLTRWFPGQQAEWRLLSYHCNEMTEADLLVNVHTVVDKVARDGGVLVTFNGEQHDLPLLRERQSRWWLFEAGAILDFMEGRRRHIDLLQERRWAGRKPGSLAECCASVGISLQEPSEVVSTRSSPRETRKADIDVIGTAAMFFYLAGDRGRTTALTRNGLISLGQFLNSAAKHQRHLSALAGNPQLSQAGRPWGSIEQAAPRVRSIRAAMRA